MMSAALAYGPYPQRVGTLGAPERVEAIGGWTTPTRELLSEFNQDQHRAPTAAEVAILKRLAARNNEVLGRMVGGHSPSRTDQMDFNTAQGLINFYLVRGRGPDNGDPVGPPRGGAEVEALIKSAVSAVPSKKSILDTIETAVSKIPVVGDVTHIVGEAVMAPFHIVEGIASGERLDHVALGALKDQIRIVKDIAPYAQTIVSLVPGVGTGVSAAIGMGTALAEGQSITAAAKAAIRGAIPGGALVTSGFDLAMKVASGENVAKATLESARETLPPEAQKAYDIGLAVVTGEKLQKALVNGIISAAPAQLQAAVAAGEQAIGSVPGLAVALKSVPAGDAVRGFKLAAGLMSHAAVGEPVLAAARAKLSPSEQQGFDAALQTQAPHTSWVAKISSRVAAPKITEPPKKTPAPVVVAMKRPGAPHAAVAYGPYPPRTGAVSAPPHGGEGHHGGGGHGHGHPFHGSRPFGRGGGQPDWWWGVPYSPEIITTTETCRTWSDPIAMPPDMEHAARVALNVSKGRPTAVRGPDNVLYQFAIENGQMTARACAGVGVGDWGQWKRAASDAWGDWSQEVKNLWYGTGRVG